MTDTNRDRTIELVFKEYYPLMCVFANTIIRNHALAEDLVQDCFVKLWHKRDKLPDKLSEAYLYTVVRNHTYNYIRDNKELLYLLPKEETGHTDHYLNQVIEAETIYQLFTALKTLPPRCKEVMTLFFLEGRNYQYIANRMNCTESTIRTQKEKGLALLKKHMNNLSEDV